MVAVPIGHPDDITVRAIRTLKTVDIIVSEDPRATQQLLMHHRIRATVVSYGPWNLKEKVDVLRQRLRHGSKVALVSDSGSPLIADPGHLLVAAAHADRIPVVPVPGPSAVIAALSTTGFPCDSFVFLGHLPNSSAHILPYVTDALNRDVPTIVFGTARSILRAVGILIATAPRRRIVLACDLTRSNEHILSGTARQVSQALTGLVNRDIALIVAGKHSRG